jgi:TRAP-type C4-dicarboxylate transport system substrate-binding protein
MGSTANKAGGPARGKVTVLTLADPDRGLLDLQEFVRASRSLSGNAIRIEIRSGWRTGEIDNDRGTLADVRAGRIDLAKIAVRSLDGLGLTDFQPLIMPLEIDSLRLERTVLAGSIPDRLLPSLRRLGVVGVALLPGAIRRPFGRFRPLVSPSAFRGQTIGIRPSLIAAATVRALGARPRGYVPGGLPTSFAGAELDPADIEGDRLDSPGTSLVRNIALWPRVLIVVANERVWRSLTPRQRSLLRLAGRQALAPAIARAGEWDRETTTTLCRRGFTLVSASRHDRTAMRRAVQPVYEQLRSRPSEMALLSQISAMKRRVRATAAEVASCSRLPAAPVVGPTQLDGVYRVSTTANDLRRAGAQEGDVISENYGTWIYVFDHGRFADTQESESACTWGYGTFTVKGHEMAWRFTDGGGNAPNGANNRPGEFFRFGWSRYRDHVTLSPIKGSVSPVNFRAKPWQLISEKPSRRYFSKRCPPPAAALSR